MIAKMDAKTTEKAGAITFARGFSASGIHIGIKRSRKDLALIVSDRPCAAAGVFTTNKVVAAPVTLSKEHLKYGAMRAVVINSGNANVCNGERGMKDARRMVDLTAEELEIQPEEVLVASTGVIGVPLPIEKIVRGIPLAVESLSTDGGGDAALGILTTDTVVKEAAVRVDDPVLGKAYVVGGMAKGSGMIHPNMATMLAFITTDASVDPSFLQETLKSAVDQSFNLISVDGDTSTNDMVVLLANGASGGKMIEAGDAAGADFQRAVTDVCTALAKKIAADGEGATKLVEVEVRGADTVDDARVAVRTISKSPLVKTAIHGEDANWGRILCAAGYSGIDFNPDRASVYLDDVKVCERGAGLPFDEEKASRVLSRDEVRIVVDLGAGNASAVGWTCDLTADYVKINGGYRT